MIQRCIVLSLLLTCVLSVPLFAADDVVARVGGVPITAFEVNVKAQKLLPLYGSFHSGVSQDKISEIQQEALDKLVERNLKVRYALQEEISVDNQVVEEAYQKAKERFPSEEAFQQAVGGNVASFRASIYRDMLAEKAQNVAVESKISVTDEQVRTYFDDNKERFKMPMRFKASHILVKVDPAASAEEKEALKERAEDLAKRAKEGEDFYDLAYYNSDDRTKYVGGDLGYFHKGRTVPEFEAALLKMEPGDVSDPVKTMYGWHIIKLVEVAQPQQLAFEDMKAKIRQQLEKEQRDSFYEAWMVSLRERFPVELVEQ